MNQSRQAETVEVKNLVGSGKSRCLFGDWPRRKLLKLTFEDYEEAESFWNPQEKLSSEILVGAPK